MIRISGLAGLALILSLALTGCDGSSTAPTPPALEAALEAAPEATPATAPAAAPVEEAAAAAAPALPADITGLDKVEDVMKQIGRSFKFLRTHITDPASDAQSLEYAQRIKLLIARAGELTPELVSKAPEVEQAGKMETFHEKLAAVPPLVDKLIAALEAGDRDAAQAAVQAMLDAEEAGHDAMGVEH